MTVSNVFFNIDAERSVIGSILLEPATLNEVDLNPNDYFLESHRLIAKAIKELSDNSKPVDLITIAEKLAAADKLDTIGGMPYLIQLSDSVPSTSNISFYEGIVKKEAKKRSMQTLLREAQERLLETESDEDIESLSSSIISELTSADSSHKGFAHVKEVMMDVIDHASQERGQVIGTPSGYVELDNMLSGFKPTELVIIGARPSMGKTAFMLNIASNAAKNGALVAMYSLEMSNLSLGQRVLSSEAQVDSRKLKIGSNALTDDQWNKIMLGSGKISETDILFNDKTGITVHQIRKDLAKLRKANPDREIICFIDYLQLIKGDAKHKGNRTQEISEISRMLKTTALELNLAIVALSQLSRGVEQRQDKRPMMSDLRESGSIEQDADVIAFLYRDDYYDKNSEMKNIIECIIAKQRDGAVGTVSLAFIKEYGRFVNLNRRFDEG